MSKGIRSKLIIITTLFLLSLAGISFYHSVLASSETELAGFNTVSTFYQSNRYTNVEDYAPASSLVTIDKINFTHLVTEMGDVYIDPDSLAFYFEITQDGKTYTWSSTVDYADAPLNSRWKERVRSALIVEAYNKNSTTFATQEAYVCGDDTDITNFTTITNGFTADIVFKARLKITVQLQVTFTNAGINVSIPNDKIQENGDYLLKTVQVYPFFGAVLEDTIPGYIFIPDGVGALIRYKTADSDIVSNYAKPFYGKDPSYESSAYLTNASSGASISVPVFGFVHGVNQNGVFACIDSGSENGTLNVYYAGKVTNYTTVFAEFTYRNVYRQPVDKSGTTISLLEEVRSDFNIAINYQILKGDDANYVGMAKCYQNQLISESVLTKNAASGDITLALDTIGIEKTTGVLFNKKIVMTTFSQFQKMAEALKERGVSQIIGTIYGFTNNGYSWNGASDTKISKSLGSTNDLEAMISQFKEIYFAFDFLKVSSKGSGYSTYNDLAKRINDQLYQYPGYNDTKYLLQVDYALSQMADTLKAIQKYGIENIYLGSIGNLLYADYDAMVSRDEAIIAYNAALASVSGQVALNSANSYLFGNLDIYHNFPMYSSQYLTFDDTVPFLAIVLNGTMELYGSSSNFYAYPKDELLRLIDFNIYPSFIVTEKSSQELQKTPLEYIYSSRFSDLEDAIVTYYQFVNDALKTVNGASLISRNIPSNGIVVNTYDNGVTLVINYTHQSYEYLGETVSPKAYEVIYED